ncbi:hypothetical protein P8C59_008848 [Phyllachora maydis]|uniref:Cupin type-2 domain-containing protein n=1 Tax=Phyllachora maydis TaxID=1825666 RepID=A0AAD9IBG0_9PEZI|nr:hypothetical protein P8C59_008848 [Phyllachora maydis]
MDPNQTGSAACLRNYSCRTCDLGSSSHSSTPRIEAGSAYTDNRVSSIVLELPPGASGPSMHWHRFHDELFLVTKGSLVFMTPEGDTQVAAGELMTVPPRAVHTFRNASETESAECYMTATPGYYVDYFRMLAKTVEEGTKLTSTETRHLMSLFGTFPPNVESEP